MSLGPFSIEQLQQVSDASGARPIVLRADYFSTLPLQEQMRLLTQRGVILLWRWEPMIGHFILMHLRSTPSGRTSFELFDPQANDSTWDTFVGDDADPNNLNGGNWMAALMRELDAHGIPITYNCNPPQRVDTDTCGLWCIIRSMMPSLTPSQFARQHHEPGL